ncbi:MAG: NnrS family protein [Novosphingobium sp.]|nr:NnrS family protein [Novosphingobium sp.]
MRPSTPGPGILFAAPHRLAFLVGSVNLLLLAAWWSLELAGRQLGWSLLPQTQAPAALLHGPLMLFLIFPAFVFGFLLTVFPRWMGYKDLGPASFGPVAGFMALGSLGVQAGIWTGEDWLVSSGFGVIVIGWAIALFVLVQIAAGIIGVWAAHVMFDLPVWQFSAKPRTGTGQWLGEGIATFGLVLTILGTIRTNKAWVPASVGLYITAAYWFTSSTSFANPAITAGRSLTDSFSGIAPGNVLGFVVAQLAGAVLAVGVARWLWGESEGD